MFILTYIKNNAIEIVAYCLGGLICLSLLSLIALVVRDGVANGSERQRVNMLLNKPGVVTVYDSNRVPKKIDIRTLRADHHTKYFTCRVDGGENISPRFYEAVFHESEIEFTNNVEGK